MTAVGPPLTACVSRCPPHRTERLSTEPREEDNERDAEQSTNVPFLLLHR